MFHLFFYRYIDIKTKNNYQTVKYVDDFSIHKTHIIVLQDHKQIKTFLLFFIYIKLQHNSRNT